MAEDGTAVRWDGVYLASGHLADSPLIFAFEEALATLTRLSFSTLVQTLCNLLCRLFYDVT